MAFTPIRGESGKFEKMKVAASQTIVKGDALVDNGSGLLATASSSTATAIDYVAMEAASSTSANDLVLCIRTEGVEFEADTDADPAATDVGTEADLATKSTVNPDASTNDIFKITAIVGAVGDRKVRGKFQTGVPLS